MGKWCVCDLSVDFIRMFDKKESEKLILLTL